jgi:hypothetical protein
MKTLPHYTANSKNSFTKIRLGNTMRGWSRFVCVSKGISHGQCPINRGLRDEELFLFTKVQTASGAHPPAFLSNKCSLPRVKQPGREADHSPPSRTEVLDGGEWSCTSTPRHTFMANNFNVKATDVIRSEQRTRFPKCTDYTNQVHSVPA